MGRYMKNGAQRQRPRLTLVLGGLFLLGLASGAGAEYAGPSGRPAPDPALAAYAPAVHVSGSLRVAGSDTMRPLVDRLAAEFRRRHPDAQVTVEGGGSASGLKEFLGNEKSKADRVTMGGLEVTLDRRKNAAPVLLAASSRLLTEEEVKLFVARYGYEPTAIPVAVDAVGVYVHRDNPLSSLTLDQVDAMFSTTRNRGYAQEVRRWGQLNLNGEWAHAPIRLYGRNQKSGTRAFLKEHVLRNGDFTPFMHEEPGAASVILALSRDPFGIGYSGIGLQVPSVRLVPLAEKEGMPFVMPSVTSVMDGSYPLRRFLYLYVNKPATASLPLVIQEFLAFVNSRDGQEAAIKAGFYPLPLKQAEQSLALLASISAH